MAELKTKPTGASVETFLNSIPDEGKRRDSFAILEMMKQITGAEPKMWGDAIIGFGDTHYKYATGREGDWFVAGFSPRKQDMTLYLVNGIQQFGQSLEKLGKYKTGVGCLYIKKLADVDLQVLEALLEKTVASVQATGSA